mmetsp:Transcript_3012/g.10867  ORF Transcript_3012/g.10867 Transcript_3012/m.10867 type:complete len:173 (-) Transcript_3012:163-681(-)
MTQRSVASEVTSRLGREFAKWTGGASWSPTKTRLESATVSRFHRPMMETDTSTGSSRAAEDCSKGGGYWWGRGDARTRRGKIFRGSNGLSRPKKSKRDAAWKEHIFDPSVHRKQDVNWEQKLGRKPQEGGEAFEFRRQGGDSPGTTTNVQERRQVPHHDMFADLMMSSFRFA